MKKKILISTGGSGGHVVPALNLYNHLKNEFDVLIYTDVRGAKYIPEKIKKIIFEVKKIPEKKYLIPIKIIFLFFAFIKSLIHFRGNKIDILISTGGYMSLPLCLSAKILKIKIYLFEPNIIIGRSNKFFLKFSEKIISYSNNLKNFPKEYQHKIFCIDPLLRKTYSDGKEEGRIILQSLLISEK